MFLKSLAEIPSNGVDSTGLTEAQKTALITAWSLFKSNFVENARNIFAEFYEQHHEYLKWFDGLENAAMHRHTEEVLNLYTTLIEHGLRNPEQFNSELFRISRLHQDVTGKDSAKLNQIIKRFILDEVQRHRTKTLEDALDSFFLQVEMKFEDSFDYDDQEL